jgi:DNA polymerase III subunit gamma/tau
MSYLALARKWRPRRFEDMTGQEHVLRALSNALDTGRLHHAFLFTGTRGVGKTSVARILAKCLNCERGVSSKPCGECAACTEIDAGRNMDVLEVDAASQSKVDETRELLENVQYAPTRNRYKVYLIDEVHMLSTHSFNALLKTLEEPPAHVKFLLATTEPEKLLPTVLSRCLQFNLKRLPISLIAARLKYILEAEQLPYEAAALQLLAQAGDGSLRDALSLLDQLLAFGNGSAKEDAARAMLGTVDREYTLKLVEHLAAGDLGALMRYAESIEQYAPDHEHVLQELASLFERIALQQAIPDYPGDELHDPQLLQSLGARISAADVQLYYQAAITGRRDLQYAPDARAGFRMSLLRMLAFRPAGTIAQQPVVPGAATRSRGATESAASAATRPALSVAAATAVAESTAASAAAPWSTVVAALELQGPTKQLAVNCTFVERDGALIRLALDARHATAHSAVREEKLAQALSRYYGSEVRVQIEKQLGEVPTPAREREQAVQQHQSDAQAAFAADPVVLSLQQQFSASIHPESVRPLKPI